MQLQNIIDVKFLLALLCCNMQWDGKQTHVTLSLEISMRTLFCYENEDGFNKSGSMEVK